MIEFKIRDKEGAPAKTIVEAWLETDPTDGTLSLYCREGTMVNRVFKLNPDKTGGTGSLCFCAHLPSLRTDDNGRLELI